MPKLPNHTDSKDLELLVKFRFLDPPSTYWIRISKGDISLEYCNQGTMCSESQISYLQTLGRRTISLHLTHTCNSTHIIVEMTQEWGGSAERWGGEGMPAEVEGELTVGLEGPGNPRLGAPAGKEQNLRLLVTSGSSTTITLSHCGKY